MYHILENFFNEDEIEAIHGELDTLKNSLEKPEGTGTAKTFIGKPKKENRGVFLDEHYKNNREESSILKLNRKIFTPEIKYELKKLHWFFGYIDDTNQDSTLVSYYKKGDYYKEHTDDSIITAIYYTWKEPKNFEGGDLYIEGQLVPIKNNSLLLFPSRLKHKVSEITEGEGRWAISQFISFKLPSQPGPGIDRYVNFLDVTEFNTVKNFLTESSSWCFKGKSNKGDNKFWYHELIDKPYFSDALVHKIMKTTNIQLKLERVYANGQSYGQSGSFHQDSIEPNTVTFLLYMNEIKRDDLDEWGGETQFKMNDRLLSFQPETNSALMFRSGLFHRGLSPSRYVNEMRITVAWKFKIVV